MSKIEKCLYIIELLSRGKPLSLKEINEHWSYSSLYDGEIIPKTFSRYKEYISNAFAIDIEYNSQSRKYAIINPEFMKNNTLYKYLLSAFHIQGLVELTLRHKEQVLLEDAPSGVEHLHVLLEAIDRKVSVEFDYHSFNKKNFYSSTVDSLFLENMGATLVSGSRAFKSENSLCVCFGAYEQYSFKRGKTYPFS